MGIQVSTIKFLNQVLDRTGTLMSRYDMLELGNQWLRPSVNLGSVSAANLWKLFFRSHVSMDINGKDGAIAVDLSKPVAVEYVARFDVITNFGFTEHVSDQYEVFNNIHYMCRHRGIVINESPGVNGNDWENCPYRYTSQFYLKMAEICGYEVIFVEDGMHEHRKGAERVRAAYCIPETSRFVTPQEFGSLGLIDKRNR